MTNIQNVAQCRTNLKKKREDILFSYVFVLCLHFHTVYSVSLVKVSPGYCEQKKVLYFFYIFNDHNKM